MLPHIFNLLMHYVERHSSSDYGLNDQGSISGRSLRQKLSRVSFSHQPPTVQWTPSPGVKAPGA